MRILHTSDWHLGEKLGRLDLRDDLTLQLHHIARYLAEHHVEVMVVSGDLFSSQCYTQRDIMHAAIQSIADAFVPFLAGGGTILAISGNHDRLPLLDTFRGVLRLALPGQQLEPNSHASGTFHLHTGPHNLNMRDHQGQIVQFQLMPFPTPAKYLKDEATDYHSPEERYQALQQAFTTVMHARANDKNFIVPQLPSVLVSHIAIRGAAMQGTYHPTGDENVLFEPSDIPTPWAYCAFGHIHCPQAISHIDHVRYAGSIMRLNVGEARDEKSCVMLDIGPSGLCDGPHLLPLPCPPVASIVVADPTQLATLPQRYPQAAQTLANIELHWNPSWERDATSVMQEICAHFPRWYARHITYNRPEMVAASDGMVVQMQSPAMVVRDYARQHLAANSDRAALLELLEELLTEGAEA